MTYLVGRSLKSWSRFHDASRPAIVIPAKAGIQETCGSREACAIFGWIPAFAGMTMMATVQS
jgi:hypothetical protein